MNIALTRGDKTGNYPKYEQWLKNIDPTINCISLYGLAKNDALDILRVCSGLLLTGGNDISPELYGKIDNDNLCLNIDKERDELEIYIIKNAIELNIPLLAICRGQQMLNVAMGGTLIMDIETDNKKNIKHKLDGAEKDFCFHSITIMENSLLNTIYKNTKADVNSYHHQALDGIADCFKCTAFTDDKIIEAIEWKEPVDKAFLLSVQWHPERMRLDDAGSMQIAQTFLHASRTFQISKYL